MPASSWPRRSWLTVSPTLVLLAAAVSSWVDVVGIELGDVDTARSGEDPEVALGDRRLAALVGARARAGSVQHRVPPPTATTPSCGGSTAGACPAASA